MSPNHADPNKTPGEIWWNINFQISKSMNKKNNQWTEINLRKKMGVSISQGTCAKCKRIEFSINEWMELYCERMKSSLNQLTEINLRKKLDLQ